MMTGYDDINNDDHLVDSDDTEDDILGWLVRGQGSNLAHCASKLKVFLIEQAAWRLRHS